MIRHILFLSAAVAVMFCSAELRAAQPENKGPAVVKLKMGEKFIELSHHKHQQLTDNQCWECHDKKIGKINNWNEATAHKICIPCHDLNQKGPVSCKGCHKK